MRDRTLRWQVATVRPLKPDIQADVFGDAPVVMPDNRLGSFRLKMQISHTAGRVYDSGRPGRDDDFRQTAMIRKRDVPPDAPDGWEPDGNDIFELAEGRKMFVMDVQPAFPARRSIRRPNGGFDGWRVSLTDRQPTVSAADQYEQ